MSQATISVKTSTPVNIATITQALVDLNKQSDTKVIVVLTGRGNVPSAMVYSGVPETPGCRTHYWVRMTGNILGSYNPGDLDGIFTQADVANLKSNTFEITPESMIPSIDELTVQ